MTDPVPWQCPSCKLWLAPYVTEHRCDPPAGGITVTPLPSGPSGWTGTSVSTAPGTITVNVSGTAMSEREVTAAIQRQLLRRQSRDWTGRSWPLRTA